jgi:hypothetical protein
MRNFRNYGDIIGTIDRFCSGGGGDQEGAEKSRGGMPKNQEGVRKLQQESKRGTGTTGGNCSIYSVIGYNSWIFGISAYRPALIVRQLYVKVHE